MANPIPLLVMTPLGSRDRSGPITPTLTGGTIEARGYYARGWQVAEATTNYVRNPRIESVVGNTNAWDAALNGPPRTPTTWTDYNGGVPSPSVGYHAHVKEGGGPNGETCYEFINRNAQFGQSGRYLAASTQVPDLVSPTLTSGASITISFDMKSENTTLYMTPGIYHRSIATGTYVFTNATGSVFNTVANTWERRSITYTVDTDWDLTAVPTIYLYGQNGPEGDKWVANVQVELKAYATPCASGADGAGHAWAGTAFSSRSTRTAGTVRVPVPGHILPSQGSVLVRYLKPSVPRFNTNTALYDIGDTTAGNELIQTRWTADTTINTVYYSNGANVGSLNLTTVPATVIPYSHYADWNGSAVSIADSLGRVATGTRTGTPTQYNSAHNIYLGSNRATQVQANAVMEALLIFDRPLTMDERNMLLNSERPWEWDGLFTSTSYSIPNYQSRMYLLRPELYKANRSNDILDDLTPHLLDITVDADIDRQGPKAEVNISLDDVSVVDENQWVAPFLNVHREDGSVQRSQMGLYVLSQPTVTYETSSAQTVTVRGQDIIRLLEQSVMTEPDITAHTCDVIGEVRRAIEAGTAARGENLVVNNTLEDGITGWTHSGISGGSAVATWSSSGGPGASPHLRVAPAVANTDNGTQWYNTTVTSFPEGATRLYAGAWAYSNLLTDQIRQEVVIEFFNTASAYIGARKAKEVYRGGTANWIHIGGTVDVIAGASKFRICMRTYFVGTVAAGYVFAFSYPSVREEYLAPVTRHDLPELGRRTGSSLSSAISHPANTPWLTRINDLLASIGCHALFATMDGRPTTQLMRSVQQGTAARTFSATGDSVLLAPVEVVRMPGTIYNTVVAVKEDYESDTTWTVVAENLDGTHPWSVQNRGRIAPTEPLVSTDAVDIDALQALADDKLERSSVSEGLQVEVLPDPDLRVHDIIEIVGTSQRHAGRWAVERLKWGMHAMDPLVEISARRTYGTHNPWRPE